MTNVQRNEFNQPQPEEAGLLEYQKKLEVLQLPKKIILLDANGTLFDENESGIPVFSAQELELFQTCVAGHRANGTDIGLNSDSPGELLRQFAQRIGLGDNCPIVSENGNVIQYGGQEIIVNPLDGIDSVKEQIRAIAMKLHIQEGKERIAPEFGGDIFDPQQAGGKYGFGYGRIASVSLFGDPHFVEKLGTQFVQEGCTVDCSPEHGFFAVHPGNYKGNKGRLLAAIAGMDQRDVTMVGNSSSDRVDPMSGARFCLVNDPAKINDQLQREATYISQEPTLRGVNDILSRLL